MIATIVLTFYGVYGFYETRYISMSIPALMILAAFTVKKGFETCISFEGNMKYVPMALAGAIILYAVAKTVYYDLYVVLKNNFIYI